MGPGQLELISHLGQVERKSRTKDVWKVVDYYLFTTDQEQLVPQAKDKDHKARWIEISQEKLSPIPEQNKMIHKTARQLIDKY